MQELIIFMDKGIVDISVIEKYEEKLDYKFPKTYKKLISKHNGLRTIKSAFNYFDEVIQKEEGNFVYFYVFDNKNLDSLYCDGIVGDFSSLDENDFYKGVIPFGGTPNGDNICFDYRDDFNTDSPKIVLVHHDAIDNNGKCMISFLANSFEEFIGLLYEYDYVNTTAINKKVGYQTQIVHATKDLKKHLEDNPSEKSKFTDIQLKNIKLGDYKIEGYTWHHDLNSNNMQLVPKTVHDQAKHIGEAQLK